MKTIRVLSNRDIVDIIGEHARTHFSTSAGLVRVEIHANHGDGMKLLADRNSVEIHVIEEELKEKHPKDG